MSLNITNYDTGVMDDFLSVIQMKNGQEITKKSKKKKQKKNKVKVPKQKKQKDVMSEAIDIYNLIDSGEVVKLDSHSEKLEEKISNIKGDDDGIQVINIDIGEQEHRYF